MMQISDYHYDLPSGLIAQTPSHPRDLSRLFIFDTSKDTIVFDTFNHLEKYLPKNSFLVMNETKVLPSRITLYKTNKGKVRVLFLVNEPLPQASHIRMMADRKVKIGDKLFFNNTEFIDVVDQDRQLFTVHFDFSRHRLYDILRKSGNMPIPPYIKHSSLNEKELREKYQTIFAKNEGSTAAPTASLHFTDSLFRKLNKKHIPHCFITLHIGMGTFGPISETNIKEKKLHNEWYEIPQETFRSINRSKKEGKELVVVGTTVVRTLESVAISPSESEGQLKSVIGKTDLFIYPPYEFKMVDHLITNFHLPESSLMMLVQAFLQYKQSKRSLVELYKIAIQEKFRFYSFGDAMLII